MSDLASLPADLHGLVDVAETSCVAACYRCLMSYFNQPDHELIDRRNDDAKGLLLRLARGATTGLDAPPLSRRSTKPSASPSDGRLQRWLELALALELPRPDAEPLTVGDARLPLVWRAHYVAAVLDEAPSSIASQLEDRGFELIALGSDETTWAESFGRLSKSLGRT